jgi:hypothetical protein
MAGAAEHIARLDRSLARGGERVRLLRLIGTQQIAFEAECQAHVRGYQPRELSAGAGITQQDVKMILSPTDIERHGWPGATPVPAGTDKRIPGKGDRIIRQGRPYAVQAGAGLYVAGELVRIELQARGGPG